MSAPRRPDTRCDWCGVKLTADVERPKRMEDGWYHSTCLSAVQTYLPPAAARLAERVAS